MMLQYDALAGLRILVVEDQLLVAMLIERMLGKLKCEVVGPLSTTEDAIAAIRKGHLDGALLDINLHGKSSLPAAKELIGREVPFIVVSGYGSCSEDTPEFKTAPRVKKPFVLADLAGRMVEVFAGAPLSRKSPRPNQVAR